MQSQDFDGFGPIHSRLADRIDGFLTPIANWLGWCGKNGKQGGMSSRIADLFWVECNCCNFYRGALVGASSLAFLQVLVYVLSVAVVAAFGLGIVAALTLVRLTAPHVAASPVAEASYFQKSEFEQTS